MKQRKLFQMILSKRLMKEMIDEEGAKNLWRGVEKVNSVKRALVDDPQKKEVAINQYQNQEKA